MERSNSIKMIALLGIIGNLFLLILKLLFGLATRSQAMIADGINSVGDVFSSLMAYVGGRITARPDDADHPYGHGKAEYIFSLIISMALLVAAVFVFRGALVNLATGTTFRYSFWLVVVAVSTIVLKLGLYFTTIDVAQKYNSLLAFATAADHRNDIFISLLTLLSVVLGHFNIYFVDAIFGMAIAVWIGYTGFTIFASAYHVLMDTTLDAAITAQMRQQIEAVDGVDHLDSLVSKPIGVNYLLIVKVSVDGHYSVLRGHQIAAQIKRQLLEYQLIADVIVHLNPLQEHPEPNQLR